VNFGVEILFAYLIVMYAVLFCRSEITNMAMATLRNFGFIGNNFNVQKTRFLSSKYFLNTTISTSITTIIIVSNSTTTTTTSISSSSSYFTVTNNNNNNTQ
jgi:hypothetical protein